MELIGKSILGTWKRSLGILLKSNSIIPTERNGDTIELQNFVVNVSSPSKNFEGVSEFDKARGINYASDSFTKYWGSVDERLNEFPSTGKKVDQMSAIISKLKDSQYNRQAYATIWSPESDSSSPYPFCIIGVYFFIRNETLNMTAILRSNDAWGQALNDMYHLVKIQKRVAEILEIPVGTYTHIAMSYHIYMSDLIKAKLYLEGDSNG